MSLSKSSRTGAADPGAPAAAAALPEGLPAGLAALLARADAGRRPPVETWDPPDCGDIDIRIDADGVWHHLGRPIRRPALVRLFARLLRREGAAIFLVTPVEKLRIRVDDAPFQAVEIDIAAAGPAQQVTLRTDAGDAVAAGAGHALSFRFGPSHGIIPYVDVRGGLLARLSRPAAAELASVYVEEAGRFGVWAGGIFHRLPDPPAGPAAAGEA